MSPDSLSIRELNWSSFDFYSLSVKPDLSVDGLSAFCKSLAAYLLIFNETLVFQLIIYYYFMLFVMD